MSLSYRVLLALNVGVWLAKTTPSVPPATEYSIGATFLQRFLSNMRAYVRVRMCVCAHAWLHVFHGDPIAECSLPCASISATNSSGWSRHRQAAESLPPAINYALRWMSNPPPPNIGSAGSQFRKSSDC